jgi:hypothetical protein
MQRRSWVRRGVAGVSLAVPLALAPALDVTVSRRSPTCRDHRPASPPGRENRRVEDATAGTAAVEALAANGASITSLPAAVPR